MCLKKSSKYIDKMIKLQEETDESTIIVLGISESIYFNSFCKVSITLIQNQMKTLQRKL